MTHRKTQYQELAEYFGITLTHTECAQWGHDKLTLLVIKKALDEGKLRIDQLFKTEEERDEFFDKNFTLSEFIRKVVERATNRMIANMEQAIERQSEMQTEQHNERMAKLEEEVSKRVHEESTAVREDRDATLGELHAERTDNGNLRDENRRLRRWLGGAAVVGAGLIGSHFIGGEGKKPLADNEIAIRKSAVADLLGVPVSKQVLSPGPLGEQLHLTVRPTHDGKIEVRWHLEKGGKNAVRTYTIPLALEVDGKNPQERNLFINILTGQQQHSSKPDTAVIRSSYLDLHTIFEELKNKMRSGILFAFNDQYIPKELSEFYKEAGLDASAINLPELQKRHGAYRVVKAFQQSDEGGFRRDRLVKLGQSLDNESKGKYRLQEKAFSLLISLELDLPDKQKILQEMREGVEQVHQSIARGNAELLEQSVTLRNELELLIGNLPLYEELHAIDKAEKDFIRKQPGRGEAGIWMD